MIEMTLLYKSFRIDIIGHEHYIAGLHPVFGYDFNDLFDIMPGGAFADHQVHAEAQLAQSLLARDGLMTRVYSCCNISLELLLVLTRIMAGHCFASLQGSFNFSSHFRFSVNHPWKIHNLAEAGNAVPGHSFRDIGDMKLGARIL
ncbi:hypothetical protein D3C77_338010 [compost metagenome]